MKIILPSPKPKILAKFFLLCLFFGTKLVSAGNSTSGNKTQTALFWLLGISSRNFFLEAEEIHKLLLIIIRERSRKIFNIS